MSTTNFAGLLVVVTVMCCTTVAGSNVDLAVIILSQPNSYHKARATILRLSLLDQAGLLNVSEPSVILTHQKWPDLTGSWTVLPLIPFLVKEFGDTKSAILFCEDDVAIDLNLLLKKLESVDLKKELFLGRALRDNEATIIHHFAFHENPLSFAYPDFASGFIISTPLLRKLEKQLQQTPSAIDFSIDAQHELAMYIWDKGTGVALTDVKYFCGFGGKSGECATQRLRKSPDCGSTITDDDVFFAVKTCHKFHRDRVAVLQKTWGRRAKHIAYFSDVADDSVPTTTLGIPNTERGHCAKFMAILDYVYSWINVTNYKWIVVTDDDTLLSVDRLKRLLSCYSPSESVALGERYGYGVLRNVGYDYITLGGGMALSRTALQQLIDTERCHCAADDSPDDMTLGLCLKHLDIPVTHSPLFHQARPVDYADGYLSNQEPVSFHRHWMIDPILVYHQWLTDGNSPSEERPSRADRRNTAETSRSEL